MHLVVLAPSHFHASLLHKKPIDIVNDTVYVYAATKDVGLKQYLAAIESFNKRDIDPTDWIPIVYTGDDFLVKMVSDMKGNVVVLAGNNRNKAEYIHAVVNAGLHVLSDKPMAINRKDFLLLEESFANAKDQNILIYDMMTERYDMLNIIEKELINDSDLFGSLQTGTLENPAVYMESVHHFYKEVSGAPLIRPEWYYDVKQQGEGIADVTTHLIDQLFWKCFPGQSIIYYQDIGEISSVHWPTEMTLSQFSKSTGLNAFPYFLNKYIDKGILYVFANGTVHFNVKGYNVGLKVLWNWEAPIGSSDTFTAVIKGTKSILKTEHNKSQGLVKNLYVQKTGERDLGDFEESLKKCINRLQSSYPFLSYEATESEDTYLINIPQEYREGHESHFTYVAERFFQYLVHRDIPEWEISNVLAKYFLTTMAVEGAHHSN